LNGAAHWTVELLQGTSRMADAPALSERLHDLRAR
jgi:hypothetical protein